MDTSLGNMKADGKDRDLHNKVKLYILYTQNNEKKKITEQIEHYHTETWSAKTVQLHMRILRKMLYI